MRQGMSGSKAKKIVHTPASGKAIHYQRRKSRFPVCGGCRTLLYGVSRNFSGARTKKVPNRPFGGALCQGCVRKHFTASARS